MAIDFVAVSPYAVPEVANVANQAVAATPTSVPDFSSIINMTSQSPLIQEVMRAALANLVPQEQQARQNLQDTFRQAGALRGGAYGVGASRLEGEFQRGRGNLLAQIVQAMLPSLISGFNQSTQNQFLPGRTLAEILSGVRPTVIGGLTGTGSQQSPSLADKFGGGSESTVNLGGSTTGARAPASTGGGASRAIENLAIDPKTGLRTDGFYLYDNNGNLVGMAPTNPLMTGNQGDLFAPQPGRSTGGGFYQDPVTGIIYNTGLPSATAKPTTPYGPWEGVNADPYYDPYGFGMTDEGSSVNIVGGEY
jgi:hypothetical protein